MSSDRHPLCYGGRCMKFDRYALLKKANEDLRKINKELIDENKSLKQKIKNDDELMNEMNNYKKQYEESLTLLNNTKSEYEKIKQDFMLERKKYCAEINDLIRTINAKNCF